MQTIICYKEIDLLEEQVEAWLQLETDDAVGSIGNWGLYTQ